MVKERQMKIMAEGLATRGPIVMDEIMLQQIEEKLIADPENYYLWSARGVLYFNHDFEKAIESFSRALAIDPFASNQYYNRGRKFLSQDRHEQALADLTLAVRLDTTDAWKWHFLGVAYFLMEKYEPAVECFKKGN